MTSLYGPLPDPATDAGWTAPPARTGFFTDTSVCIGCKACEVACKEWNAVPEDGLNLLGSSYDNTGALGASTWRHVKFIEQPKPLGSQEPGMAGTPAGPPVTDLLNRAADRALSGDRTALGTDTTAVDLGMPSLALPGQADGAQRTEFGSVVVQDEICNGCGYCVPACPFGVIDRRVGERGSTPKVGIAQKCTLCYDRIGDGLQPACATACPTQSIQYGDVDELRERAQQRVDALHRAGVHDARLYGEDGHDGVGGLGAFFLLLDEPEVYGLPPDPVVTTRDLPGMWRQAALAAAALLAAAVAVFAGGRG